MNRLTNFYRALVIVLAILLVIAQIEAYDEPQTTQEQP